MTDYKRRILGIPDEIWIIFLLVTGLFLKLVYVTNTGHTGMTPSLGQWSEAIDPAPSGGVLGMIQYLYTHHSLPSFDPRIMTGYLNPPLYVFMCSGLMELFHRLLKCGIDFSFTLILWANAGFVTAGSLYAVQILRRFETGRRKLLIAALLLFLFPGFYPVAASLDGSALFYMLIMASFSAGADYYFARRRRDVLKMAFSFGLAMMTCYQAAVFLPFYVLVFAQAVKDGKRNKTSTGRLIALFAVIASVLSLWWPLYLLVRFLIPPFTVDRGLEQSYSLAGNVSFIKRLMPPSVSLFRNVVTTGRRSVEYNIWAQFFKTSVNDYAALDTTQVYSEFAVFLVILSGAVISVLMHIVWFIRLFGTGAKKAFERWLFFSYIGVLFLHVLICLKTGDIRTMSFRTFSPVLFFVVSGYALSEKGGVTNRTSRAVSHIVNFLVPCFALLSAFLYGFYFLV